MITVQHFMWGKGGVCPFFDWRDIMNIKIIIATHKKYQMPTDDIYLPIQVGAEGKELIGYQPDNVGDNISYKNSNFCELTGLYWAWKNLNADYIGLVHYRRYFKSKQKNSDKFFQIIKKNELENILKKEPIIVPKRRNYHIETVYDHYSHTFYKEDLDCVKIVIKKFYPEYLLSFEKVMEGKKIHIYNMFVMRKDLLNEYCEWLFDILFKVEEKLDITNYNPFEARVFGRISERLLDVWLLTNKYTYQEVPVMYMEPINWYKKVSSFLLAKFFGKKYKQSF